MDRLIDRSIDVGRTGEESIHMSKQNHGRVCVDAPRSVAPYQTDEPFPIVTCPMTLAVGATKAELWMAGTLPACFTTLVEGVTAACGIGGFWSMGTVGQSITPHRNTPAPRCKMPSTGRSIDRT